MPMLLNRFDDLLAKAFGVQRFNESRGCCLNEMIRMSPIAFL